MLYSSDESRTIKKIYEGVPAERRPPGRYCSSTISVEEIVERSVWTEQLKADGSRPEQVTKYYRGVKTLQMLLSHKKKQV